ncbi:2-phosphosulfolactate phosphatase [Paenibacillus sp. PAMC21692]|uniref:2-phosphosulfolactate phosphatase n=1 Tax=Paenibacillus sp. PAMC21692 TaxID=2762320 RepID=UPI00164E7D47|nr:2-phosphosulfolactate phosphatase [Paenibacillus sp. PAMC21692]QNK55464.1 2-phosphosulfolactate phosphatase [Paenibacillus sp. PAMC21692]
MMVQVISSVNEACAAKFHHKTAIVIDVLRATSTIAAALSAGASSVLPAETVMDAKSLHRPGDLLGGERFCRRIAGFDLGNSPSEYNSDTVKGRKVILTTTNGTRAIHKSTRADHVIAASLLNAETCAAFALELKRDIIIMCAGSHDEFALEDGLCAGLLLHHLRKPGDVSLETDDFGTAMESLYADNRDRMETILMNSASGKRLLKLGQKSDIAYCARVNTLQEVPYLVGDVLVSRR